MSSKSTGTSKSHKKSKEKYIDINPNDIMILRHPLETKITKSEILDSKNLPHNKNIIKKSLVSETAFYSQCRGENPKYNNFHITPIQKAMTYCMMYHGGSATSDQMVHFITHFWPTILEYNNSRQPGHAATKYNNPPDRRIIHMNYSLVRNNLPYFIPYEDNKWGPNTIDGVTLDGVDGRRWSNKDLLESKKSSQSKRRAKSPHQKQESNKTHQKQNSKKEQQKQESTKPHQKQESTKPHQKQESTKPHQKQESTKPPKSSTVDESQQINHQQPIENQSFEELNKEDNSNDHEENLVFQFLDEDFEGSTFQDIVLDILKKKSMDNGMKIEYIIPRCQKYKEMKGAYFELPLEQRVKAVLQMKKHLNEVDYNEHSKLWHLAQMKTDEAKIHRPYIPDALSGIQMKNLTINDLWNILKDTKLL